LNSRRKRLKRRCWAASVAAGGAAVAVLSVPCMRSWRPFCCGLPGAIRSGVMPSFSHQIDSRDRPPAPTLANGRPVSLRIARGHPNSRDSPADGGLEVRVAGPPHRLAGQQVTAAGVAYRERIAAPAVAGSKPALEVDRPDVVGRLGFGKGLRVWRAVTPPTPDVRLALAA